MVEKALLAAGVLLGVVLLAVGGVEGWGLGVVLGAAIGGPCVWKLLEPPGCSVRGCSGPEMDYTGRCAIGCGYPGGERSDESCPAAP